MNRSSLANSILFLLLTSMSVYAQSKPDSIYFSKDLQVKPDFRGGRDSLTFFIATNLSYPVEAKKAGVAGRVFVGFVVNKDGSLSDIKINKSVSPELDAEALRVVKLMPPWTPGQRDGVAVRCRMGMPLNFAISATNEADSARWIVDVKAQFPGGQDAFMKFQKENIRYPKDALPNRHEGHVIISFVVERDGTLTDVVLRRGIFKSCDEEAMRVFSLMPKWVPAMKDGKVVRAKSYVRIIFSLGK